MCAVMPRKSLPRTEIFSLFKSKVKIEGEERESQGKEQGREGRSKGERGQRAGMRAGMRVCMKSE